MKNQRKIDLIVVHCSATRINQDFPVEALEACHKARGFHSIGYHYYITKDGVVYPCRPESEEGARNRYALRLAGHQSPRHGCAGWDRLGTAC